MLSVVILTYNSIKFIKSCLDSVFFQDCKDLEVIVVDNGSCDATVSVIKETYPTVKLIENKENLGTAKARNQGIEIARGKWILTLDCDTILHKDFLSVIVKVTKDCHSIVGMIQPKILKDDRKTIYSAGIYLSRIRRFFDIGKGNLDSGHFDHQKYIFGSCSAAAFYRREMLEEIKEDSGYFDERFFFLVEDVDLAWRAQRKGWKGIFLPSAKCYHYGNSSDSDRKLRQYLCFRNRYYMINKNESILGFLKLFLFGLFYETAHFIFLLLTNEYLLRDMGRKLYENKSCEVY